MTMMLRSLVCVTTLFASAHGHGYVKAPASRNYACKQGSNKNCGGVQYEPQSVEGADRYPDSGPSDGTLAAAGQDNWAALNEQSATRWAKTSISSGLVDFTWQFTANHITRDWRYYITKEGWNGVTPLGRETLESSPFCTVDGAMVQPPMVVTHSCTVPTRSGYHVVLAIWDVGDTAASFYNAIDLDFNGASNNFGGGSSSSGNGNGGSTTTATPVPTPAPTPTPTPTPAGGSTVPVSTPVPTPVPTNPPSPAGTCSGPKIAEWGSCLSSPSCCEAPSRCYQQSQWYAQCRVKCDVASQCKLIG
eukprot:TRINITY_DN508_c1_g1_i12.p1 TRINITY_DN508_c1_g1~~TRINITY_DN508_c1_g1_i12.p1  ORF type:complete len:304 (+),score=106.17 TRINITY_DN508_c1_g1_i12:88-999(+)